MSYTLPKLEYGYGDLSVAISQKVMELHHSKHHQAYVDKLNVATDGVDVSQGLESLLKNLPDVPDDVRESVRNNGGGHLNHSMFWQLMSPGGGGQPGGELALKLSDKYGSFQAFVDEFNKASLGIFGSGWAWLMPDLSITTTPNQDNPIMYGQQMPILGLDVWEHAYYLDYKNSREAYAKAWWEVVAWGEVEKRLASAIIS